MAKRFVRLDCDRLLKDLPFPSIELPDAMKAFGFTPVTKKCIYRWHAIGRVPTDQLAIVLFIANASGLRIDLYDYLVEEEADDSCRAVAA